jgi:hypothetical protein
MPEFVLVLTQSRHVRVLAESLEEAKRFVARADTDDLSSIDRCDGYFHWTLEVLEPHDPTFQWADGKALYRLDEGNLEEDLCEICRHQSAADWWGAGKFAGASALLADTQHVPLDAGVARKYRLCAGCLKLAAALPPLASEAELAAALGRLRVQAVAAIRQRQVEEREAWERREREKEG